MFTESMVLTLEYIIGVTFKVRFIKQLVPDLKNEVIRVIGEIEP